MPKGTKVDNVYQALLAKFGDEGKAAREHPPDPRHGPPDPDRDLRGGRSGQEVRGTQEVEEARLREPAAATDDLLAEDRDVG